MNAAVRLLLDQGLPRDAASLLRKAEQQCVHVGELGMSMASDLEILTHARDQGSTVVTLDADFHTILAVTEAVRPSVIRIRLQGLNAAAVVRVISDVLGKYAAEIVQG